MEGYSTTWTEETYGQLLREFETLSDEKYKSFHAGLVPGIKRLYGVRMPQLKAIAKQIAKGDYRSFLQIAKDSTYEETVLQGLVIGFIKAPAAEILALTAGFIPMIDSWAVCDSFCSGLKIAGKNKKLFWDFLIPYLQSGQEYQIRFAVVMLMDYFIVPDYIDGVLAILKSVSHEGYYVKMAVAWAVSVCFIKFRDKTLDFLGNWDTADDFTYNKSLQKILESYRAADGDKAVIRGMKRRHAEPE